MSPDDLPDPPPTKRRRVPDPTSTNLGVPRRGEKIEYPSLGDALSDPAPPPQPPHAPPRSWDAEAGRWVDERPELPSDPALPTYDSALPEAPTSSFDFPDDLSDLPLDTEEHEPPPKGWIQRIARWLGRG